MTYGLSKSKILSGLQCAKRLWLEVHQPDLAKQTEAAGQFIQIGNDVHDAARSLVASGILIEHFDDLKAALEETRTVMEQSPNTPFFEGTFEHNGVLIRADLIFPESVGSRLVEVKAAGSLKDYHVQDCAIQTWVLEGAGVPIKTAEVAVVDTSFVYAGERDYRGLFKYIDVTERIRALMPQMPAWVQQCRTVLEGPVPNVGSGDQCNNPFTCPFLEHCCEPGPEYPVTCLPQKGEIVNELLAEGIFDIGAIPEGRLSRAIQERVRRVTKSGKPEINSAVVAILKQFPYPRYYLDFETIAFAVPRWAGTRPYQPIPFQWSCHIERADVEIEHRWFLDTSGKFPAERVAESLINELGNSGPIFMYSAYEKRIVNDLMRLVPSSATGLGAILDRLVDLKPIVKDHCYHPDMKGSWSLKPVTACIAPEISHAHLQEVTDGMAAQRAYLEIVDPGTNRARKEDLETKLLEYCGLDTMAMVEIVRFLQHSGAKHASPISTAW